jgi:ABC-type glycerol-3-phosphate transport system permease component
MAGDLSFNPQSAAVLLAGSLLASLPAVLLFLRLQRQFVAGLQAGATKG